LEEGKAELVKWHEDLTAFKNSMEICLFMIYPWAVPGRSVPRMLARFHEAVTGIPMNEDELLRIGERIINIERAFNAREGATRRDDSLPWRFLEEPYPDGPAKGQVVRLEPMLDEYYAFRGWDRATGLPSRRKLTDLGLEDAADELQNLGKLPAEQ
jgi:aldehyde:ferredoxin oxidoreductase